MNKNHLQLLSLSVALAAAIPAHAAEKDEKPAKAPAAAVDSFLDDSDEALGGMASAVGARRDAEAFVAEKGWKLGRNKDGRYVAIGSASIGGQPSSPNFQALRQTAYIKAMVDAKQQVAMHLAETIATETFFSLLEGRRGEGPMKPAGAEPPKTPVSPTIAEKVKALVHLKLDKALERNGKPVAQPTEQQVKQAEKAVLTTDLYRSISRMTQAEVGALVTQKLIEDGTAIVVVTYYSPKTKELLDAILGKGTVTLQKPQEETLSQWIQAWKTSELYASQGVQIRVDETGQPNVICFGQAPVSINSTQGLNTAIGKAETIAAGVLRDFAGELVSADIQMQMVEKSQEFGQMDKALAETEVDSSYQQTVKARAENLTVQGKETIRTWSTKDTRSGRVIAGAVVAWSFSNAVAADADRTAFAQSAGSKGGSGTVGSSGPAATAATKTGARPAASPTKETYDPTAKTRNKVQSREADPF